MSGLNNSNYLNSQIAWLNEPFLENIINILKTIGIMYFSLGYLKNSYFHYTLLNILALGLGLKFCWQKFKEKNYILCIIFILILLSPIFLTFLLGNHEPVRAQFSLPIVVALIIIFNWVDKKYFKILITILIISQSLIMITFEYSDYIRFQNDKIMAEEIFEKVKDYLPDRKLVIVGAKDSDVSEKIKIRGEAMGISFFNHYGLSDRATTFMRTLGYKIEDDRSYISEATKLVENLEIYPSENSILVNDKYVIVKLS